MRSSPLRCLAALLLAFTLLVTPSAPTVASAGTGDAPPTTGQPYGAVRIAARLALVGDGEDLYSVHRLYLAYFLREPDESGLQYWLDRYAAGMPLAEISDSFATSKEFEDTYGAQSDEQFVRLVYQNVLEREPDQGGFDHWMASLAAGMTRGEMMIGFSDSGEFKSVTDLIGSGPDSLSVERLYQAYFLREGDEDGLAYWKAQYTDLASLLAISDAFAASREFRERYGSLTNTQFVDLVYRNVLGRNPDSAGRQHWLSRLAAGMSRGTMMVGFSDSAEYKRTGGAEFDPDTDPDTDPGAECPTRDESTLPWAPDDEYGFLFRDDCEHPVQWAPCQSVDVVANFTGAPTVAGDPNAARKALLEALDQLSEATKLDWNFAGETDERADDYDYTRPLSDPARYGDGFSPILVSWPAKWTDPRGATAYATPFWSTIDDPATGREELRIVTGQVVFDGGWQPNDRVILVSALLHELGHNAGLDHVSDSVQTMFPIFRQRDSYADGDLAGLARVGSWLTDCATV